MKGNLHEAILCIGSNVAPRGERIASAIEQLAGVCEAMDVSDRLESADVTGQGAPYVNVALRCLTSAERDIFTAYISEIERSGGRKMDSKSEVAIDVDLVIWDGEVVSCADYNSAFFRPLYAQLVGTIASGNEDGISFRNIGL